MCTGGLKGRVKACLEGSKRPTVTGFGGVDRDLGFSVCVGWVAGEAEEANQSQISKGLCTFSV